MATHADPTAEIELTSDIADDHPLSDRQIDKAIDAGELHVQPRVAAAAAETPSGPREGQPQWPRSGNAITYTYKQPQWAATDEERERIEVARQAPSAAPNTCVKCRHPKEDCVCTVCYVCLSSVGFGTRHHCRKCWRPVCSSCRTRRRYINAMAWVNTLAPVCDTCAVQRGLASTSDDPRYHGLAVLRDVMDFPRQCVNRDTCGGFTYRASCSGCSLPTVPARPHVERLVRVDYCCSVGKKCAKCSSAQQRMAEEERRNEQRRHRAFRELTPERVEAIWASVTGGVALDGLLNGLSDSQSRDVILAVLCASICYEYVGYPHTSMQLSDVPVAQALLRLRECKQDYSVFDAPNDVVVIAFPGTHDVRTAITDVRFSRVHEVAWGGLHDGLVRGGPSLPLRQLHGGVTQLWSYRLHRGFHNEELKLRMSLPTSYAADLVASGKRIIFCGHSLGGALASLVTLRHLSEDLPTFRGKVSCITLGAPLIGNTALTHRIEQSGWTGLFTHLVYRSDIVPRLLTSRDAHKFAALALKSAVTDGVARFRTLLGRGKSEADEASPKPSEGRNKPPAMPEHSGQEMAGRAEDDDEDVMPQEANPAKDAPRGGKFGLGKLAFDCYGTYHMLERDVPYKCLADSEAAFTALRGGDGLKTDVADHLLDAYNRGLATRFYAHIAAKKAVASPEADPAPA